MNTRVFAEMNRLRTLFFIGSISFLASCLYLKTMDYSSLQNDKKNFSILFWTTMFGKEDLNLGLGSHIFKNCKFSNCFTTQNRSLLEIKRFSALIFHHSDFETNDLPSERSTEQFYIYFNLESPIYTIWKPANSFFNWTMTYRSDSDIVHPYGYLKKRNTDYRTPKPEDITRRPKKIAWLVSNCNSASGREEIAKEINLYMPVDIIGDCNPDSTIYCPADSTQECYRVMEGNYKFYLSFENSLCKDYATEKFFNILKLDIIPIVYGNSNYSKISPPNSVINVKDYKNVSDLVEYLEILDRNPDLYLKYFEWKKNYTVEIYPEKTLCDLCEKLNEPIVYKTYDDLVKWWYSETCEPRYEPDDDDETTEQSNETFFRSLIQK